MSEVRNVVVEGQEFSVVRYWIIGSGLVVFSVLEEERGTFPEYEHSATWSFHDRESMGKVSSRRLPEELDRLPSYSEERYSRVQEWRNDLHALCHRVILEAYPETAGDVRGRYCEADYELIFENGQEAKGYCGLS